MRKRSSFEVNDQGDAVKAEVKECLNDAVRGFRIVVEKVYDNGFGPSPEARESMKRFSNARQEAQIADANIASGAKRDQAADVNAAIAAKAYMRYKSLGVP